MGNCSDILLANVMSLLSQFLGQEYRTLSEFVWGNKKVNRLEYEMGKLQKQASTLRLKVVISR